MRCILIACTRLAVGGTTLARREDRDITLAIAARLPDPAAIAGFLQPFPRCVVLDSRFF